MPVNWFALIVFVVFFGLVTLLGFAAAHWRRGDLDLLHEWGLAGGRFGTLVTWFLLGGDLYTAYTFIAVPASLYGSGALAFFAVPYTIVVYPFVFMVFPRPGRSERSHGYITAADFVRGRYGNKWLALAVAVTGIFATMPYIALQLVGIQVVIAGMGVESTGLLGDLPLVIAFVIFLLMNLPNSVKTITGDIITYGNMPLSSVLSSAEFSLLGTIALTMSNTYLNMLFLESYLFNSFFKKEVLTILRVIKPPTRRNFNKYSQYPSCIIKNKTNSHM